jgi:predicted RNase H-like HicB family nuclease
MLYPVYVHHDEGSAYGAIVPDFEGCFAAADSLKELAAAVQEAAGALFEGEDAGIPEPSDPEELDEFQGGSWAFIDIDTTKLNTAKERVNISVPAFALREIDDYISRLGENRSHFLYTTALKVIRGEFSEIVQVKVPRQYKAAPAKKKVAAKKQVAVKKNAASKKKTASKKKAAARRPAAVA